MGFGEPAKFNLARQVAAALAYIALADLDRIAVCAYTDNIVADFPLTRGKAKIVNLLAFLESLQVQGSQTNIAKVATGFVHRSQRRGLALVISDLYDPTGYERGLDILRHHRYEPHVIQIHDLKEANPNLLGDVELEDVENEAIRKVTVTEKNLKQYKRIFETFLQSVQNYCRSYGIGCTMTTSEVPFDELVLKMMRTAGSVG